MGRAGIFVLRNTSTGEQYVGQSKDIDNQRKKQDSLMRNGRHYNNYIQQDYNMGHRFSFSILEYCNPSQLNQRKNYWIRQLNTFNNGYNQTGRNRNTSYRMVRNTYSTYNPPTQETPNHIKLINQIKNSEKNNESSIKQEDNDGEKKILQDKLESALDKYNRRFGRLKRWLKIRYLILFIIIIYICPPFVANISLIVLAIVWISIFLAKMEYNSYVDKLNEYGYNYEKMNHSTIKVLNILAGNDSENNFDKIENDMGSNNVADDQEVNNTKKDYKWNICPSCNHMLNSAAKKCPYCGYVIED